MYYMYDDSDISVYLKVKYIVIKCLLQKLIYILDYITTKP